MGKNWLLLQMQLIAIIVMTTSPVTPLWAKVVDDKAWYLGMNALYFAYQNSYTTQWIGGGKAWIQDIDVNLQNGLGEYVEGGRTLYDRKLSVGLSLFYASISTGQVSNILDTYMSGALISFEYVFNNEEDINLYAGIGLGATYLYSNGRYYSAHLVSNSATEDTYVSGSFSGLTSGAFAYNFRLGIYLAGNKPVLMRIGYQYLSTANPGNTYDIASAESATTFYRAPSIYGNSTMYKRDLKASVNITTLQFHDSIFEIGMVFLFMD